MLRKIGRRARNARRAMSLYAPPGHFYSPSSNRKNREYQESWDAIGDIPGIRLREAEQLQTARRLAEVTTAFAARRWRGAPENTMFGCLDARVLFGMLALERPGRIVEVGSGYSTAVMLDAADSIGTTRDITCVEPYPQRLYGRLLPADRIDIRVAPVQSVGLNLFQGLKAGDLLFIDSTHVAKAGSDVLYLYLNILPRLAPGVLVHIHDIFWPFSYRPEWLREGRDWTESYFLRALLIENPRWEIVFFNDWVWTQHPQTGNAIYPAVADSRPGSLYVRRV